MSYARPHCRRAAFATLIVGMLSSSIAVGEETAPWRIADAIGLPPQLDFGVHSRLRFEHLEGDFREPREISASALVLRTLVHAKARFDPVEVGFELIDSRAWSGDEAAITTREVDALVLLEAYVKAAGRGLLLAKDHLEGRAGRITLDLGSRRLLARQIYRNTVNGFTGADLSYACGCGHELRLLAAMPVVQQPRAGERVRDNEYQRNEENPDTGLFGFLYRSPAIYGIARLELYNLSLFERDGDFESRNRELWTPGLRLFAKPAAGKVDGEFEAAAQLGTSRASADPTDTTDLDHRAYMLHAQLGYSIPTSWSPRLLAELDYASGDDDPTDDSNERFDFLYGVPRFDLSVTGLFRPVVRSNLMSAGLRLHFRPDSRVDGFVSQRVFWLASATDAWTTTGFRDPTGESGRLLGSQFEGRLRFKVLPGNLAFELGGARLRLAGFANKVAAKSTDPVIYFYTQLTGSI